MPTFTPKHILSLGAGVQSSTTALMAAHGEITPALEGAIFADTQDEPFAVYDWLNYLEAKLPFPIHKVTAGKLSDNLLTFKVTEDGRRFNKTGVPWFTRNADGSDGKIKHRKCTKDFKISPILKECRTFIKDELPEWRAAHRSALKALSTWRVEALKARKLKEAEPIRPHEAWMECQADPLIIQWIGISLDEISRMKESQSPYIVNRWPLVEMRMTRHDCLRWMETHGYPKPPRSACRFCPFRNNHEWRMMKEQFPEDFKIAVEFERQLHKEREGTWSLKATPFIHRSLVPLDQVDFSTEEDRGQINLFNLECEGMCGV